MPSQAFLTKQAVLDATLEQYPASVALSGAGKTLEVNSWQWLGWSDDVQSYFIQSVRRHYARLVKIHGGGE